ncbi:hypothetical protein THRCLA_20481 [Thraustotheca clavata]|uniref:Uncharacterized protein n=1 Tax=Thraustotheca clavata TaxID=74557 RepID=A0A1W0A6U1_9STRA|nr:hypothetical protein THRCLA_20481 [Thraustotheca clavata]
MLVAAMYVPAFCVPTKQTKRIETTLACRTRGVKRPCQDIVENMNSPLKKQKTTHEKIEKDDIVETLEDLEVDIEEALDRFHPQILGRYYDFDKTHNLKVYSCRPWNNKPVVKGRFNVMTRKPVYRPKRYPPVDWTLPLFPHVSSGRQCV